MFLLSRIEKAATPGVTADMRMMLLLGVSVEEVAVLSGYEIRIGSRDLLDPLLDCAGGLIANLVCNFLSGIII